MGNLGGDNETPYQWLMLGSLLSLVGALTLRRRQARLMQLVLLSFAPYAVFLALYWLLARA